MTDPTPLSPAAQAVMNAFVSIAGEGHRHQSAAVAAALCAAVDQVLPDCQEPGLGTCDIDLYTEHQRKRSALLAIAAELDPTTETK